MLFYAAVLAFAFALTYALTPLAGRFGLALGIVDEPGGRRQHTGVVPRTGGLALFAGFTITVMLVIVLPLIAPESVRGWFPPHEDPHEARRLAALLGGSLFCVLFGFLDDKFDLPSGPQYLAQFASSLIAIAGLIFIKHVNNPFGDGLLYGEGGLPWWLVMPLTIFWFMGMMNTINWLDGLSGLVVGVTAILCAVLAGQMLFRAVPPQLSVAILPIALLGVSLGFLPFNFSPARIFMGSSGSYFIGYAIACLGIMGGARLATVMLVLGLPALDVAWLIVQRLRRGDKPTEAGRDHLHFRLSDMGLSERTIVYGYWAFCAVFGLLTLMLDDKVYKLVALLGLGMVALGVLIWAGNAETVERPSE